VIKMWEEPDIEYCPKCDDYVIVAKGFVCERCGTKTRNTK